MSPQPAPTLLLAALRRPDAMGRRQVEDRCTEVLASLIARHESVADWAWEFFTGSGPVGALTATTQMHSAGVGRPDLVLIDAGKQSCWVEVKVDAPETSRQSVKYSGACDHLATLEKRGSSGFEALPEGTVQKTWDELAEGLSALGGLGPSFDEKYFDWRSAESSGLETDVAEFLLFLNHEGVVPMCPTVNADDLGLFGDNWFERIDRVMTLGTEARLDAFRSLETDEWTTEILDARRKLGRSDSRFLLESESGHRCEWWWAAARYAGDQIAVEASISAVPYWRDRAEWDSPGFAVGYTLTESDPDEDLILRFDELCAAQTELRPAKQLGDSRLRSYDFIPFGDFLEGGGQFQRARLAEALASRLAVLMLPFVS